MSHLERQKTFTAPVWIDKFWRNSDQRGAADLPDPFEMFLAQ